VALIAAGVVILLFVVYQLYGTGIAEAHSQKELEKQFQAAVGSLRGADSSGPSKASGVGPNPAPPPVQAIDHLVIPAIGVNKYVVQGVSDDDLREGPGHYPETVMPGEDGNAGIAGHRTTYGAPFYRLNDLKPGDEILLTDLHARTFAYKVSRPPLVVSPGDVAVLDPTSFAQLTLTTCDPRFSATSRLIVMARLVGTPLPAPKTPVAGSGLTPAQSGLTPAQSGLTTLNGGDAGAWPGALGWGMFVVVLWAATRFAAIRTRRWWRLGCYVLGIGLCLLTLWFCFENIVLLLPSSI
jgi:sortase A